MVGAVVLATKQGLGYLAGDFARHVIDKVYVYPHTTRENHYDWFPNRVSKIDDLLDCKSILMFETPLDWTIIPKARQKNIKTILMPMYECTPYPPPYVPDIFITPSDLDQQYYPQGIRLNVPVPDEITWKLREKAQVFVHNAGNGGLGGRNGTRQLIEAMQYVKAPIKLIIRSQVPIKQINDPRIEYRIGTFDDIWSEGDVFVFPEKFNGLSLPMQEAFASGMLVMGGDRFPINTWLPKEPLIPVEKYTNEQLMTKFQSANYTPQTIAKTIDEWYNKDITNYSLLGKKFKEENSWKNLKEKYEEVLLRL